MDLNIVYELYREMLKIRFSEEAIIKEYPNQEIKNPVHLYIGEEAVAVGVSASLKDDDYVMSNHRSHGHCIAKGMDLKSFFKELYGKKGGVTNGKGGSMHLVDKEIGILGTSAIVAGGISIAVGAALKQKIKNEKNITVVYFGDGAVDEGVFWESINFASLHKLPILFVMEDNNFASQTSADMRHSYEDICDIVSGFNVQTYDIDGNDVISVYKTCNKVINQIREKSGPMFLHCKTYRWMGHVGHFDDTDTGYRLKEEVDYWKLKCPIKNMERYIEFIDKENYKVKIDEIQQSLIEEIQNSIVEAKEEDYALD